MGQVSTPAKDVIRLPWELNGEMRTSRCVPFSPKNRKLEIYYIIVINSIVLTSYIDV